MSQISQKRLEEIKSNIEEAYQYFSDNINRFQEFMRLVFDTTLTNEQITALEAIGRPPIEFNILEAYVSARRAEFARHQPEVVVKAADGVPAEVFTKQYVDTIELIEAYMRGITQSKTSKLEYDTFSDLLAGGWSVLRVYTDYCNSMSFDQNIYIEKLQDPCMAFFDPLAKECDKSDGKFCGEVYPLTKKQFIERFGKASLEGMSYSRSLEGFNWSYNNDKEDIILVADYYEKKIKKERIYKLTNGSVVRAKEYDEVSKFWAENTILEQMPAIVDERETDIETIIRYRLCQNKILDKVETNYPGFPLIYVDGNSVMLVKDGQTTQMTRPYVYHALGIQKLKNVSGQALAFELETSIQHKFIAAEEALPTKPEYLEAYINVQKSSTLIYKFQDENNPEQTLPAPVPVQRAPIPAEYSQTFTLSDQMTQAILGSYDNAMGMQRADLSGIALARTSILSNNSAVPYQMGYIKGIKRALDLILKLIPLYYITPRTLPVVLPSGKREYAKINQKNGLYMRYDSNTLQVQVDIGVNYAMQKEISLQTITQMMQASQSFADFFNKYGLSVLLDNIDIRGIEALKEKANQYEKDLQQQQQQAMQLQMQQAQTQEALAQKELNTPNQNELGMMALQQQAVRDQEKQRLDAAKVSIDEQQAQTKFIEVLSKIRSQNLQNNIKIAEVNAEEARTAVDMINAMGKVTSDIEE
ncbi:hypothetical protein YTPLAS21_19180 [Candidatus Nitrosocosmicus sp.]|nr:hypothetical protein YTPLAS21_19180 [Candidatus Nitrosocosmicus sp.]